MKDIGNLAVRLNLVYSEGDYPGFCGTSGTQIQFQYLGLSYSMHSKVEIYQ